MSWHLQWPIVLTTLELHPDSIDLVSLVGLNDLAVYSLPPRPAWFIACCNILATVELDRAWYGFSRDKKTGWSIADYRRWSVLSMYAWSTCTGPSFWLELWQQNQSCPSNFLSHRKLNWGYHLIQNAHAPLWRSEKSHLLQHHIPRHKALHPGRVIALRCKWVALTLVSSGQVPNKIWNDCMSITGVFTHGAWVADFVSPLVSFWILSWWAGLGLSIALYRHDRAAIVETSCDWGLSQESDETQTLY